MEFDGCFYLKHLTAAQINIFIAWGRAPMGIKPLILTLLVPCPIHWAQYMRQDKANKNCIYVFVWFSRFWRNSWRTFVQFIRRLSSYQLTTLCRRWILLGEVLHLHRRVPAFKNVLVKMIFPLRCFRPMVSSACSVSRPCLWQREGDSLGQSRGSR